MVVALEVGKRENTGAHFGVSISAPFLRRRDSKANHRVAALRGLLQAG